MSGDAPLQVTCCAEELLQVIVGTRQIVDLVTLKESLSIASGHLAEVCDCRSEIAQVLLLLFHRLKQLFIRLLERLHLTLFSISQQMSGLMNPDIGLLNGWEDEKLWPLSRFAREA